MRQRVLAASLVLLVLLSPLLAPAPVAADPEPQAALQVGGVAQVTGVAPDPLNVRAEPSKSATIVTTLPEGARVRLLDGPKSADGETWWKLAKEDSVFSLGWAVQTYLAPAGSGGARPAAPSAAAAAPSAAPSVARSAASLPVMTATAIAAAASSPTPTPTESATPATTPPGGSTNVSAPARPTGMAIGNAARVTGAGGDGLNVRSAPGGAVLGVLQDGDTVQLLDGPVSANGYNWWKVSAVGRGLEGWCVDAWLSPADPQALAGGSASLAGPPVLSSATGSAATWIKRTSSGVLAGPRAGAGFCVHLYGQDRQRVYDLIKGAGFTWVKQQVEWRWHEVAPGEYNWGELDDIVNGADQNNLGVILSIVKAPGFYRAAGGDGPPDNPATLERFMREISSHYGAKVQAYEIWNEANLAVEWGYGNINAGEFVELLRAGYQGVKAGNANAVVIMGALTPTGVNDWQIAADDVAYLRAMYAYRDGVVSRYFDALGAHPSGFNNPPDDGPDKMTKVSDTFKGHNSFYFRRVEELYGVMKANGDGDKQVWLTEFGWDSTSSPPKGYEYGGEISEEDQAAYLVRAFQKGQQDYPWMGVMAVWNLNFQAVVGADDEKWGFGVVKADYSPRLAYTALAAMPK